MEQARGVHNRKHCYDCRPVNYLRRTSWRESKQRGYRRMKTQALAQLRRMVA